ncbi:MAG: PAS domain-containing protein [Deltaproteobacteria bacterium]|nr:PAS domain-containing protein [Deltaproteobacteria bacterium]
MPKKPTYEELEQRVKELESEISGYTARERVLERQGFEKTAILDSLLEHVVYQDDEMNVLWANQAACDSVGMAREDLIGRHCYEVWAGRESTCEDCPVEKARRTGQPQTVEKKTPDGRWWHIEGYPVRDNNAKTIGTVEFTVDISDHKRTAEALRKARDELELRVEERTAELTEANKQLRHEIKERKQAEGALEKITNEQAVLLSTVPVMIFWIDKEGNFIRVNDSFAAALHKSPDDIKGKSLFDLYPEDMARQYYDANLEVIESGTAKTYIVEPVETPAGTMWVRTDKIPHRDEKGEVVGIVGFSEDITEGKQAGEALQKRTHDLDERVKELNCLYGILHLVEDPGNSLEQILRGTVDLVPLSLQYPEITRARIMLEGQEFGTQEFKETDWKQASDIVVHGKTMGTIEVCCLEERPESDEGPFLTEERMLIEGIAGQLGRIIERKQAEERAEKLSRQLIQAQDTERQMIALELHDRVAQDLSSLKIACETLLDDQPEVHDEITQKVSQLSQLCEGIITAVRDLSYDLRPIGMDRRRIARGISRYCQDFSEKTGLSVDFTSAGLADTRLDYDTRVNVYRLVQEALNNTRKHANAKHVTIKMLAAFPNIVIRIRDDGKGFDVEKRMANMTSEKHMGLRSMEERVNLLGGKMTIKSRLGQGTKLFIEVPLKEEKDGS